MKQGEGGGRENVKVCVDRCRVSLRSLNRCVRRNEGFRGFYKGIVPSVLRVTPASAVTLVVYEFMLKHWPSTGSSSV